MRPRLVTGIMTVMFSSSVALIVGCGDQGPMTYRTWSDTRAVRVIQFDKATTPEATLNEWDAKGVHWRQDKDHYYVDETDIGKTTENVALNTVLTPFALAVDGTVVAVCVVGFVVVSGGAPAVVGPGVVGADAIIGAQSNTALAVSAGATAGAVIATTATNLPADPHKPRSGTIRVVVFPKATTSESETKRWTDADMRWFQDDTHYFVPVTDIGKVVQEVRFRALPEPLMATVDGRRLEGVTEATPWESRH